MYKSVKRIVFIVLGVCFALNFNTIAVHAAESWLWPVPAVKELSQGYKPGHEAIDINNSTCQGKPIYAAKSGVIHTIYTGCNNWNGLANGNIACKYKKVCNPNYDLGYNENVYCNHGFGRGVIIDHQDGTFSSYAHMETLADLKQYTYVKQGTYLGTIGSYGASTGPHLHFIISSTPHGIGFNNNPTNSDIPNREGWYSNRAITYIYSTDQVGTPTLSVSAADSLSDTKISWTSASNAKSYNLRIKKYESGAYKTYKDAWKLTSTSYSVKLPAGKYSVYVDACNGDKYTASNTVEFTVRNGVAVTVSAGDSLTKTTFKWNTISEADTYNLRIKKKESGTYKTYIDVWGAKGGTYSAIMPAGSYSVYVDACNTTTNKVWPSKTVTFTINPGTCKHSNIIIKNKAKATTSKNGYTGDKFCLNCNSKISSGKTIYYPKTVSLSTTTYTYNEKVKKPSVTVKDSKGNTISSSNYSVTYANGRKNVGKYTVKVTFKGNYSGSVSKTFKINPKNTSISKLSKAKKAFTVKWKKPSSTYRKQMTGYQIRYSTSSKMTGSKTVTVKSTTANSKKISKLKAKKYYYVQVRTYKKIGSTYYYSGWSKVKKVKTK